MGPCAWSVEPGQVCDAWSGFTPAQQAAALSAATTFLWAATGRRYGLCEVTVQPQPRPARGPAYRAYPVALGGGNGGYYPYIRDGQWFNPGTGGCGCSGDSACQAALQGPTTTARVTAVRVDGVTVPPAAYVVADGYLLVRTDGECWPTCVTITRQDPPGFEVDYTRGLPVPADVAVAAGLLACEIAKSLAGGACGLNSTVRSMTRQGVEFEVADIAAPDARGLLTGLRDVDLVIRAHNPYGRAQRGRIYSPDAPAARTVT